MAGLFSCLSIETVDRRRSHGGGWGGTVPLYRVKSTGVWGEGGGCGDSGMQMTK